MTSDPKDFKVVGHSVPKVDAMGLACGLEPYVHDFDTGDALCGYVVPSPHAHARIKKIDAAKARAMKGVHAVLTWQDLPRIAHTTAGQGYPEPSAYDSFVLDHKVRFVGDKVALVVADSRDLAEAAGKALEIEWEVLPAVVDPDKAMDEGAPVIHDQPEAVMPIPVPYDPKKNLAAGATMGAGDLEKALSGSYLVHRGTWRTHYAQHCALETHACYGYLDAKGRIVLVSATQVPFHARRITAQALGIPVRRVRVIKPRIGGGFGSKQEVLLEPCVAAMVLKTRRKVLLKMTRQEEFVSRTRHPMKVSLEGGFNADGTINGVRMDILSNTGAYGGHALTVMTNSGSKVLPLYRMKAVTFDAKAVYTNLPVAGAYRGYGATQAAFAMECFLDEVAEKLKLDPVELRRRDHIGSGEGSPVFAALGEGGAGVDQKIGSCGLPECIELGAKAIGWAERRGKPGDGPKKRGVGMCTLMQGSSIPEIDMASVSLRMNDDGSFILTAGATDVGTGADTMLAQIAAEVLGLDETEIVVHSSDTDFTPFDVGAYASSTTYLSGEAARKAAMDVALQVREVAADYLNEILKVEPRPDPVKLVLREGRVFAPGGQSVTLSQVAKRSLYERDQHQIAANASAISKKSPPPFSAQFAEVEVDTETGFVKVLKYVAAVDCGTAINPKLAEGQIEGAVLNGISYALTEELHLEESGRARNARFADYKLFSTLDVPEIVSILVPTYEESGPFGAKSVGEIGINGPCPVIANAIFDAVGVRLRETPFTPEKVLAAIRQKAKQVRAGRPPPRGLAGT